MTDSNNDRLIHPDDVDAITKMYVDTLRLSYEPQHYYNMRVMGLLPGIEFAIGMMEGTAKRIREEAERRAREQQNGDQP